MEIWLNAELPSILPFPSFIIIHKMHAITSQNLSRIGNNAGVSIQQMIEAADVVVVFIQTWNSVLKMDGEFRCNYCIRYVRYAESIQLPSLFHFVHFEDSSISRMVMQQQPRRAHLLT